MIWLPSLWFLSLPLSQVIAVPLKLLIAKEVCAKSQCGTKIIQKYFSSRDSLVILLVLNVALLSFFFFFLSSLGLGLPSLKAPAETGY